MDKLFDVLNSKYISSKKPCYRSLSSNNAKVEEALNVGTVMTSKQKVLIKAINQLDLIMTVLYKASMV